MAENTKIEWCDHTFNPWIGCMKVSAGCAHCYAETQDKHRKWTPEGFGKGKPRTRTSAANWRQPVRWNAAAEKTQRACGEGICAACGSGNWYANNKGPVTCAYCLSEERRMPPRPRVFCASLADWLDDEVPVEWLADLLVIIFHTPNLDWLKLSKRLENWTLRIKAARDYLTSRDADTAIWLNDWLRGKPPANVWIGATVENQDMADKRIPELLRIPARVRFLSCEPLLGAVDLQRPIPGPDLDQGGGTKICQPWYIQSGIHWVICGGESGPHARPMHPDWARSLRDQCAAAGVPFFFKQWGEWAATYERANDPDWRNCPSAKMDTQRWMNLDGGHGFHGERVVFMERVGKRAAGRLLDGVEHSEFPVTKGGA